jgi:hypothetical protein
MGQMGVIFDINRDFPYQVPLSFDEAAIMATATRSWSL